MLSEKYEAVIGLEVHAQLNTRTKLFTPSIADYGNEPNTQTDPVVLGMPGVLPVLNREAVSLAVRAGLATDCEINRHSRFARKHYFYPDLPKGYQISQFEEPICSNGKVAIRLDGKTKEVRLNRIHMEEDAGKSIHNESFIREGCSYVDLNRAGVPLVEIVTEPDLSSSEEAGAYLKALRAILRCIGASDADMEKGQMRCDANVSIRPVGQKELGTRTEIKNVNSFRNVMRAIDHELDRHEAVIEDGGAIKQETRLWDPDKSVTRSMRSKEESDDYRYMPDPDLLPLEVSDELLAKVKETMPELPAARRQRLVAKMGLADSDAEQLVEEKTVADYFEAVVAGGIDPKKAANWVLNDLSARLKDSDRTLETCNVGPDALAKLIALIDRGDISGKIAKTVLDEMFSGGGDPAEIVEAKGLKQVSDSGELEKMADKVLEANPDKVEAYRGGKTKLMGFFVGQIMQASKGKADPKALNEILARKLKG